MVWTYFISQMLTETLQRSYHKGGNRQKRYHVGVTTTLKKGKKAPFLSLSLSIPCYAHALSIENNFTEWLFCMNQAIMRNHKLQERDAHKVCACCCPWGRRQRRQGVSTGWNIKYSLVLYKSLVLLASHSHWSLMTGRKHGSQLCKEIAIVPNVK